MRLLVVEDDPGIASFLVKGLKEAGFAVDEAGNGGTALDMASSEPYDLAGPSELEGGERVHRCRDWVSRSCRDPCRDTVAIRAKCLSVKRYRTAFPAPRDVATRLSTRLRRSR